MPTQQRDCGAREGGADITCNTSELASGLSTRHIGGIVTDKRPTGKLREEALDMGVQGPAPTSTNEKLGKTLARGPARTLRLAPGTERG